MYTRNTSNERFDYAAAFLRMKSNVTMLTASWLAAHRRDCRRGRPPQTMTLTADRACWEIFRKRFISLSFVNWTVLSNGTCTEIRACPLTMLGSRERTCASAKQSSARAAGREQRRVYLFRLFGSLARFVMANVHVCAGTRGHDGTTFGFVAPRWRVSDTRRSKRDTLSRTMKL